MLSPIYQDVGWRKSGEVRTWEGGAKQSSYAMRVETKIRNPGLCPPRCNSLVPDSYELIDFLYSQLRLIPVLGPLLPRPIGHISGSSRSLLGLRRMVSDVIGAGCLSMRRRWTILPQRKSAFGVCNDEISLFSVVGVYLLLFTYKKNPSRSAIVAYY